MDQARLNRYVGDYEKFQEVYAMKKSQLEAAYNKQQKSAGLKVLLHNKTCLQQIMTCRSRRNLIKWI